MFSKISAFVAISLLFGVSATPTRPGSHVGATYVITNNPTENTVLSAVFDADGNLSWGNAVSTQGKGAHGKNANPAAGDGLFSQDSVVVWDKYLFTVNAGSNTVVMFAIDETNPANLTLVGDPVDSGGEFPQSIAVSPNGLACVVNGGAKAGVLCYDVNPSKGLTPLPSTWRPLALNQTTPPSGPPGSVSDVVFSEDSTTLLVSVKGIAPAPGFIYSWRVDGKSLSQEANKYQGGMVPFSLTQIRGQPAAWLNADPGVGVGVWDFTKQPVNDTLFPIPGQKAICWSEYSEKTGNYYLMDAGAALITELGISEGTLTPSIVGQYNVTNGMGTIDFTIAALETSEDIIRGQFWRPKTTRSREYLFVLSGGTTSVIGFALEGVGKVRQVSELNYNSTGVAGVSSMNIQGMASWVGIH